MHAPADAHPRLAGGSEFELLWCAHLLAEPVPFDFDRLTRALTALGAKGSGAYWVLPCSAELEETGFGLRVDDRTVVCPPFDLDEADFVRLEATLGSIVREGI